MILSRTNPRTRTYDFHRPMKNLMTERWTNENDFYENNRNMIWSRTTNFERQSKQDWKHDVIYDQLEIRKKKKIWLKNRIGGNKIFWWRNILNVIFSSFQHTWGAIWATIGQRSGRDCRRA